MLLSSSSNTEKIVALVNVSNATNYLDVNCYDLGLQKSVLTDLITNKVYSISSKRRVLGITLSPYQICWLR